MYWQWSLRAIRSLHRQTGGRWPIGRIVRGPLGATRGCLTPKSRLVKDFESLSDKELMSSSEMDIHSHGNKGARRFTLSR